MPHSAATGASGFLSRDLRRVGTVALSLSAQPRSSRGFFGAAGVGQAMVVSPGISPYVLGFQPANIISGLATYLS
ncbi:MAG: hypothetical protein ACRDFX_10735 [Chloroflexota bacterium]